jgi:hypothetical protein
MLKKKGQIVPKYLCKSIEKKAQHLVKFGADVEVTGRTIKLLGEGCAIYIPAVTHVSKKKQQKTVKGFEFVGVHIDTTGLGGAVALDQFPLTKISIAYAAPLVARCYYSSES